MRDLITWIDRTDAARTGRYLGVLSLLGLAWLLFSGDISAKGSAPATELKRPRMAVNTVQLSSVDMPGQLNASGNVEAWQEIRIGAEEANLKLKDVRVNIGDVVRKGDVLAVFDDTLLEAERTQAQAVLTEAEAMATEAQRDAERARALQSSGALSQQQVMRSLTAERSAIARVAAQRAALKVQETRLAHTRVLAPDGGVVSSRTASMGSDVLQGQELFRMVRLQRLEWRAELASTQLARIRPGMQALINLPSGESVWGTVRAVAPTVDRQTRNGMIYVDLPIAGPGKAGMFAKGSIALGTERLNTLPTSAVEIKEGLNYVLRVGANGQLERLRVDVGRRVGQLVEIKGSELRTTDKVVADGGTFLNSGDVVSLVGPSPSTQTAPSGKDAALRTVANAR